MNIISQLFAKKQRPKEPEIGRLSLRPGGMNIYRANKETLTEETNKSELQSIAKRKK